MRASLIIASHNESDRLWRTVASCVETSAGLDCEIVIADDASWDDSVEETLRRFPQVHVVRHEERKGASPTKDLGARHARGDTLIFLDGHTKPESGAIQRLIEDVERLKGEAIITPAVTGLCVTRWKTLSQQTGHGYSLELERLDCAWLPLSALRQHPHRDRLFYESPALIGCAFAVHRELYDDLRGFDRHMLCWGVEDLDFGLKCWLMGHPILHDPEAVIGHRFQQRFDNFEVPIERLLVNQLRMARKNFTEAVWSDWIERCRRRYPGKLTGHPEGLWARAWDLFGELRASVEHERAYLLARRVHDEFWFAERFDLPWPRLQTDEAAPNATATREFLAASASEPEPVPTPTGSNCSLVELLGKVGDGPESGGPLDANVGDSLSVRVVVVPTGCTFAAGQPTWTFTAPTGSTFQSPGAVPSAGATSFSFTPDLPGTYTLTASADNSDSVTFNVQNSGLIVRLDKLVGYAVAAPGSGSSSGGPPPTPSEGPLDANVGDTVHIDALPNPSTGTFNPAPTWTFMQMPDGSQVSLNPPANPTPGQESREFVPDVAGLYIVYANAQHPEDNSFENDSIEINVQDSGSIVRLDKLVGYVVPEADNGSSSGGPPPTPSEGPLDANVGDTVHVNALPNPSTGTFNPAPLWSFLQLPAGSQVSLTPPANPTPGQESREFVPDVAGLYVVYANAQHPEDNTFENDQIEINVIDDLSVEINSYDARFAPSVERMNLTYSIKPAGATAAAAKLEIFKKGDATTPIYTDATIPKTGANIVYKQGGVAGWDGKTDSGAYITPHDSEYTVRVTVSEEADFANPKSANGTTNVEVHSLEINLNTATEVIVNNPDELKNNNEHKEKVSVLVKLKKKDGSGERTTVPMFVHFSFTGNETEKEDSYPSLGKKGDPNATYWAAHPDAVSDSTDNYKLVCRGTTITDPAKDYGKTRVWFKPSRVGGDDFTLKAAVKHTDGAELKTVTSAVLTVWRAVKFKAIYEMAGETHVSTNATVAIIQPFFDPAFVKYAVGPIRPISPAMSVKYIGLYYSDSSPQLDWSSVQLKKATVNHKLKYGPHEGAMVDSEVPTNTELANASLPDGDAAQGPAREMITKRAQAWVERIDNSYLTCLQFWKNDNAPTGSIVAIKHYHPKYSSAANEFTTNEWPDWVRVTVFAGQYNGVDPDGLFVNIRGDTTYNVTTVAKGQPDATAQLTIVHEVGHYTKGYINRYVFGPGDHSESEGLMSNVSPMPEFSGTEIKILKGKKR